MIVAHIGAEIAFQPQNETMTGAGTPYCCSMRAKVAAFVLISAWPR